MTSPPTPTNELFDEAAAYDQAKLRRNRRSELMHSGKMKPMPVNREAVYAFVDGAKWQHEMMRAKLSEAEMREKCLQLERQAIAKLFDQLTQKLEAAEAERDDINSVCAAIEEQAKKNSDYDDMRIKKLESVIAELEAELRRSNEIIDQFFEGKGWIPKCDFEKMLKENTTLTAQVARLREALVSARHEIMFGAKKNLVPMIDKALAARKEK